MKRQEVRLMRGASKGKCFQEFLGYMLGFDGEWSGGGHLTTGVFTHILSAGLH